MYAVSAGHRSCNLEMKGGTPYIILTGESIDITVQNADISINTPSLCTDTMQGTWKNMMATMMNTAKHMKQQKAMEIISKFGQQEKRYVAALLGTIMVTDNYLNERELKFWQLASALCGLPKMTINEAATSMRNQYAHYAPASQQTSASLSSSVYGSIVIDASICDKGIELCVLNV